MIRGLPENYLFPGNNKVWHGIVAWHFCLILIVQMCGLLLKGRQVKIITKKHRGSIGCDANVPSVILPVFTKDKEFTGNKKRILVYDGRYPSAWTNAIISWTCSSCFLVSFRSFWINRPILTICNR